MSHNVAQCILCEQIMIVACGGGKGAMSLIFEKPNKIILKYSNKQKYIYNN